ncbi:MAG: peptide chain release factor 3 [Myxococcota bacterium]|nr:peptide chain release factor 3 [Myxococcota bacterium]
MTIASEAARRRTFGIISHPDAGKTTLTEKLLLYSGAIHLAGSVKSRKASRHAVSDWMKMEQDKGISITSSVLQFEYLGSALNLLDTPGHADFSEDTYRVLAAVDSAVMLIDHAKGVEARTLKLFEVCRMRKLPIVTFMNKLDRFGLDPLTLLDEISSTLDLKVVPLNWPIGMGSDFKGVVDLRTKKAYLFEGSRHGTKQAKTQIIDFKDTVDILGEELHEQVAEEIELVEDAGDQFTTEGFLAGEISPVFWGSALSNFGVEPLLEFLAAEASPPRKRETTEGMFIEPETEEFSGFIFKVQANMNPKHRDRIAFMRVVSGRFARGMDVRIARNNEKIRLAKPHSFLAQERSIVEEAFPGDIVGLYDPGKLRLGDTLTESKRIKFTGIPRFAPEFFARTVLKDPMRRKQLTQGLTQLSHEGVIQLFYRPEIGRHDPYLGAVGMLQFEVLKERLRNEYKVNADITMLPFQVARWVGGSPEALEWLEARRDYPVLRDRNEQPVLLSESSWSLNFALQNAPGLELYDVEPL